MEWISVEKAPPGELRWVLVACDYVGDRRWWMNIAMLDGDEWKFINTAGDAQDFGRPIYWKPLPPPPTKEPHE